VNNRCNIGKLIQTKKFFFQKIVLYLLHEKINIRLAADCDSIWQLHPDYPPEAWMPTHTGYVWVLIKTN
jgi:hypothetical protein